MFVKGFQPGKRLPKFGILDFRENMPPNPYYPTQDFPGQPPINHLYIVPAIFFLDSQGGVLYSPFSKKNKLVWGSKGLAGKCLGP